MQGCRRVQVAGWFTGRGWQRMQHAHGTFWGDWPPLPQVSEAAGVQIWRKELSGGRVALMALNLNAAVVDVPLVWATHVPELAQK